MRLRDRRHCEKPEVMIIPMIDIMFFLLVFFMLSTLYMVDLKTVGINLPQAAYSDVQTKTEYVITMKADGTVWLEDKEISRTALLDRIKIERERNPRCSVVLRADRALDYGTVMVLLDELKGAGIVRIGLAAGSGDSL